MTVPVFVYLDFGKRPSAHLREGEVGIEIEMHYSLATLTADKSAPHKIAVYTDKPDIYVARGVDVIDLSTLDAPDFKDRSYVMRLKPVVLLDALARYGGVCVFLDSDTYIYEGFTAAVNAMVEKGAILWDVTYDAPKAWFPEAAASSPNAARHRPGLKGRPKGNSGVIGVKSGWGEPFLQDVLHIIDFERARGKLFRELEQAAIFEAVWLNGIEASDSRPWLHHYSTNSQKRYMHWQIKRLLKHKGTPLPPGPPAIVRTRSRVKLYQWYWSVKRKALGLPRH